MLTKRNIERAVGIIFLLFIVSIIMGIATEVEVDTDIGEFRQSLQDVADDRQQNRVSVAFHVLSNLLTVAIASTLYLAFRLHDRPLALLATLSFLAGGVTFMVDDATRFVVDRMALQFVVAGAAEADIIATSARGIALMGEFAFNVGLPLLVWRWSSQVSSSRGQGPFPRP